MTITNINSYPSKIKNAEITTRQAINFISTFISENYKIFNLQQYDEDFRSEIVISFLESGDKFLSAYNPDIGDFFPYLYCYINSIAYSKIRERAKVRIKDRILLTEGINTHYEKEFYYNRLQYNISEVPKIPYAHKKINPEELKQAFSKIPYHNRDKKILALALKSSFYLTDEQVHKVCELYKIDVDIFYKTIQYFKETIDVKNEKRSKFIERRNYCYYHRTKFSLELKNKYDSIANNGDIELYQLLIENLERKKAKHEKNWKTINNKFEKGFLFLRPTTKSVSEIMGICEREVTYLLNSAKTEALKNENKKNVD